MKTIDLFLAAAFLTLSCSDSAQNSKTRSDLSSDSQVRTTSSSCLISKRDNPCELFGTSDAAKLSGTAESELKVSTNTVMKNKEYNYCQYNWPSDRMSTVQMGSREMEIPITNVISVGFIKELTQENLIGEEQSFTEYFDRVYGVVTDEKRERMQKAVNEVTEESEIGDRSKQMVDKMVSEQEFTMIEDLGDMASYEIQSSNGVKTVILHALHNNALFQVHVDISGDSSEDVKIAKEVAKKILAACD